MASITPKPSTFDENYNEICRIVNSRQASWTHLSLMEWKDVRAISIERVWKQWWRYDTSRPLENWCNTVISNVFKNLIRDLRGRYERPCCGGGKANGSACVHNLGGDACEVTPSKIQCEECPLYAEWAKTRQHQFNIKSPVAFENHLQEAHSIQEDFCDYDGIKDQLDKQMKAELTPWEYKIYVCLYVQHLSPTQTREKLEALVKTWKRAPREDEQYDYQTILAKKRWFRELMVECLKRDGHIDT